MQNMLHIEFLLLMHHITDSCNSHGTWDAKFNACPRTICQHRVNAATGLCACLWAGLLKQEALIPAWFSALIPASQISCMSCQQIWADRWIYPLWQQNSISKSSAADLRPFLTGTMVSVRMAGTCSGPNLLTNTASLREILWNSASGVSSFIMLAAVNVCRMRACCWISLEIMRLGNKADGYKTSE